MTTQWHPLFAHLLRPMLEKYYAVETGLPVGDAPREADIVLLLRTGVAPPFRGLWRRLRVWNVVEFKGPTVTARVADLDLLIELGLGIDRRLNEQRRKDNQRQVQRADVSMWYLGNHLGRRFLRDARGLLGELTEDGPGVWRATVMGRGLFLVSNRDVPVEHDSVPVHLLVREPVESTRVLARQVVSQPELWKLYGSWLTTMFPDLMKEIASMATSELKQLLEQVIDMRPVIKELGLANVIRQVDVKEVVEAIGVKKMVEAVGVDAIADTLSPEQWDALLKHRPASQGGKGKSKRRNTTEE